LIFLILEHRFLVTNIFPRLIEMLYFLSDLFICVFNMFFSQLYFELLHFNFLIDCLKLTAVLYILTLLFVFLYKGFCILDGILLLVNEFLDPIYFFFYPGLR